MLGSEENISWCETVRESATEIGIFSGLSWYKNLNVMFGVFMGLEKLLDFYNLLAASGS